MAVEPARRELQARLQEVIGPDATDTLMDELGSLGREHSSLRQEVQLGFARAEAQMADLRSELKTDMAQLRGEFGELRSEFADLRADMAGFQAGITAEVAGLRVELSDRLSDVTRHLMVGVLSAMGLLSGITFGIARLV